MTRQRIGFGLPNEITLVILHMLSDYGLSQLMGVCRLLHEHALRILLIRATVLDRIGRDLPKEIVMHDYPRLRALDALAWTYLVTTLDLFDCKIKGTESHLLSTICRCLKYSQTIQTVKISMSVNEWVSLSDPLGRAISWQIIPLIKSLESTHCQSLSLEERQCWIPEQTLYASAPKLEAAIKALRPLTTLTSLTLSIPLLFARDFRSWTVQTMNLSPLQYLRIEDWTTEAGSWGVVFEFLRLKHLQKLELSVCNLPAPCLTRFLKRHNCLTELSVTQEPKPAFAILDCRALPRLRSLTCTPSLALAFLQGRSSLPSLTSLEIVQCEAATPRTLEAILRRLSKRPSPNDMHLGFSRSTFTRDLFLERWIATCNELALNPSFKGLAHVRSLLLETRCSKLNEEKAVAALQCFPSLKSVNFLIDDYEEWYTEDSLYDIGERIVDDYPGLDGKVCFTV